MTQVTIKAADGGSFSAYVAQPTSHPAPGLVVIQEIFGVNKVMRDLCDHYASLGYVAICPDLFWRIEPGIDITDKTEEEWNKAFSLFQAFDQDTGVQDIQATIAFLREYEACNGKVGTVGFCLGGKLAYLAATRTDADASVGYYGVGIEQALDEAAKITRPLMLHIATEDQFCPPEAQKAIHARLDGHDQVTLHDYQGQDHAFAREGGAHYDRASADLADQRSLAFFKSAIG
ncbi:MAG: dienelactone hydrolase family protein [Azospirillaceae bacterium]